MKKLAFLFTLLFLPIMAIAQNSQSVVTFKNGTELKGVIKSIDPTDALILVIAGVETTIKMTDVAKVEAVGEPSPINANIDKKEKLIVTDKAEYPESFDLKVGDTSLKMILVRGGDLNMGYNGRHSISMRSEPIHRVGITSFYISETFVTSELVGEVTEKKRKVSKGFYKVGSWAKAYELVKKISQKSGIQLRLPTEAEWEYSACSPEQDVLFSTCNSLECCLDWFGAFYDIEYKIDPLGPVKGTDHVTRAYYGSRGKFDRCASVYNNWNSCYFRVVIKATDVVKSLQL